MTDVLLSLQQTVIDEAHISKWLKHPKLVFVPEMDIVVICFQTVCEVDGLQ